MVLIITISTIGLIYIFAIFVFKFLIICYDGAPEWLEWLRSIFWPLMLLIFIVSGIIEFIHILKEGGRYK
jgi:uncharacterized protein involved in cysteine biosynthesis